VIAIEANLGKLLDFLDTSTSLYSDYLSHYRRKDSSFTFKSTRSDYLAEKQNTDCIICPPGYYCQRGSIIPIPCPIGSFCEHQSAEPMMCQKGTYNNQTKQYKCTECEPGRVCLSDNMDSTSPCPPGFVCPDYGIGTLDSNITIADFKSASPCPPSEYCPLGAVDHGLSCPAGYYCPEGSSSPTECYAGTFQNLTGMSYCFDCPPGYYCKQTNMTAPTPCIAGKVCNTTDLIFPTLLCPEGNICPKKTGEYPGFTPLPIFWPWGFEKPIPCPKGRFCYQGTASEETLPGYYETPQKCNIGEYNPSDGQGKCKPCDAGAQCTTQGMNSKELCPKGTYRPDDPGQIDCLPCPAGYYGYEEGSSSLEGCKICPAGIVCISYGLIIDQFQICI
jgi:hypothetical protein